MLLAQTPATPAREAPRPQDIDPAVDTSRTPADSGAVRGSAAASGRESRRRHLGEPAGPCSTCARRRRACGAREPAPSNSATGTSGAARRRGRGDLGQPGGASRTQGKGRALDRLELDTTQITGNRELPKVLYIVPWKRSDLGDLVGKPVNSLLDEVLDPGGP